MPIDKFKLCDFNVDSGYDDHMFHMLGGNVDHFESLGYFSGYDTALDPYCLSLVEHFLWFFFWFLYGFNFEMTNFIFCANFHVLSSPRLWTSHRGIWQASKGFDSVYFG